MPTSRLPLPIAEGTSLRRGVTELIGRISRQASVAGAVEEQTATTDEISSNVGGR